MTYNVFDGTLNLAQSTHSGDTKVKTDSQTYTDMRGQPDCLMPPARNRRWRHKEKENDKMNKYRLYN